ncbi:YaaR family protein [Clostridium fallax]|uniref:DUF327 domain-containing protein n=1 Tax=Clostridium fallax TaxID=1533 RepID=A0A1M4YYX2_9CLOT|nr:YaaR family protein [Clostridium fallax]SHF11011.1 hypothetical protein SAMN05443638_13412 [Clostridium fallax]SQB07377.1 Protein of uncharacterised function (DUF327) [Clostridium fallax]
MEIGRVLNKNSINREMKKVDNRKEFSKNFSREKERRSEEELKKFIEDIKKKGNRLVITKCYADVRVYKKMIKEYLESVLKYMYSVKKDISFWQTQYFITVDTIDEKLEELTEMLLGEEKDNLKIASTIDEIQGLVVDIYR